LQDKTTSLQQQIENAKQDLVFAMQQYELKKVELAQTKQSNDKNLEKTKLDNSIKSNPLTTQEKQLYAAQAASARLSYQEKLNDLKKATLTSPVSGVILTVNGNVGEQSSADFVTIGTNGYKYVVVSIDEDEIGMIQAGQQARITPSAIDDLTITGTVYYIANAGTTDNNGVVTFQAFVSFYTDDPRLKTAMNVEVEFIKKTVENVLIVPIKAVFPYENSPHVKLIDGTLRKVITGLSDGKQVEVIS
jgi:HlyD family secretion protein